MMLKSSLFFFFLIGAVFAQLEMEEDIFMPYADPPVPANCTKPGKMCSTCSQVSYCIEMPDGELNKQDLFTCPDGQTCMESLNDCTNQTNPKCDSNIVNFEFLCRQLGTFPDPFDCTKYHVCVQDGTRAMAVKPKPNSYKCGGNYSYDPLTTQCRNKLINGTCQNPAPPCSLPGQTGVIKGNPSLYYICFKASPTTPAFPNMFSCLNGFVYNGQKCEDQSSPLATGPDGKCTAKGWFSDQSDCRIYIECSDKNAIPISRFCAAGYKYSYFKQTCVELTC